MRFPFHLTNFCNQKNLHSFSSLFFFTFRYRGWGTEIFIYWLWDDIRIQVTKDLRQCIRRTQKSGHYEYDTPNEKTQVKVLFTNCGLTCALTLIFRSFQGIYECQISTTPPVGHFVYLTVVGKLNYIALISLNLFSHF